MRERGLVLAHQVNDVTQRLNGHLVALQGGDNDLAKLIDDTGMVGRGNGNIRELRTSPRYGTNFLAITIG